MTFRQMQTFEKSNNDKRQAYRKEFPLELEDKEDPDASDRRKKLTDELIEAANSGPIKNMLGTRDSNELELLKLDFISDGPK